MTEYVKSTNFASKDALATGNPLKIVKGTEIDTEFNNIATAVATKADLNSPALIGTPTAPTAAAGTNTTQLATTAFVTTALQACYPVGSLYINATNSSNPSTLLGFGTWSAFGAGRVPVGYDASNSNFNTAEKTGGSADAIVVAHSHSATSTSTFSGDALPNHSHSVSLSVGNPLSGGSYGAAGVEYVGSNSFSTTSISAGTPSGSVSTATTVSSTGSSGTDANLQPYITVYMWKRTA